MSETGGGGRFVTRVTRWVEARTLRSADRVVVIHERFADYAVRELGVSADKVEVVRNWTHLPPRAPIEAKVAREALGWPKDSLVALHTGNMGVKQGLENLVEAARLADDRSIPITFVLVGDGAERQALEVRARGVKRIVFTDPLDTEHYRMALAAADVLLVNEKPGVSNMSVPSKLTSYFDAGRPIVAATDVSGITASEIGIAGAGIVVAAGNPSQLIDAILEIDADPVRAGLLGNSGRQYRERMLSAERAMDRWDEIFQGLS